LLGIPQGESLSTFNKRNIMTKYIRKKSRSLKRNPKQNNRFFHLSNPCQFNLATDKMENPFFKNAENRERSKILQHCFEWTISACDGLKITSNQINAFRLVNVAAAWDLFTALTAKGKDKPKNKANILRKLAPICAQY